MHRQHMAIHGNIISMSIEMVSFVSFVIDYKPGHAA